MLLIYSCIVNLIFYLFYGIMLKYRNLSFRIERYSASHRRFQLFCTGSSFYIRLNIYFVNLSCINILILFILCVVMLKYRNANIRIARYSTSRRRFLLLCTGFSFSIRLNIYFVSLSCINTLILFILCVVMLKYRNANIRITRYSDSCCCFQWFCTGFSFYIWLHALIVNLSYMNILILFILCVVIMMMNYTYTIFRIILNLANLIYLF